MMRPVDTHTHTHTHVDVGRFHAQPRARREIWVAEPTSADVADSMRRDLRRQTLVIASLAKLQSMSTLPSFSRCRIPGLTVLDEQTQLD